MQEIHKVSISYVTGVLCELLTRRRVAFMVGHRNTDSVRNWMCFKSHPTDEEEKKLRVAYEIYILLQEVEKDKKVIKAWFVGKNIDMDGDLFGRTVLEAIQLGNFSEAERAARLFYIE